MISQKEVFSIRNESDFEKVALAVFRYQAENNLVYREYLKHLGIETNHIHFIEDIPFLPIRFFKEFRIQTGNSEVEKIFMSSGTTGTKTSKHYVIDLSWYKMSLSESFLHFYGNLKEYNIFALLPSYLEREGSSLIDMVQFWMEKSEHGNFYLYNHAKLYEDLQRSENLGKKAILIGVSFALLDFVDNYQLNLKHTIVMETGGMKGRKEEITRKELHEKLKKGFGVKNIHSEYGMTELLSQAYSNGNSNFETPNWMKILIRDTEDPFHFLENEKTGGVNVIDLANIHSCSFIETEDLGKMYKNGNFEVLGRFDHSDIRGCNLMVSDV